MAQQLQHTGSEVRFIVILLLLAYVMSSAPKYIRDMRENSGQIENSDPFPFRELLRAGKAYTIQPYKRAWQSLSPKVELVAGYLSAQ